MKANSAKKDPSLPEIECFIVGVVVEKRKLDNPWVDHIWLPAAILPGAPQAAPWTVLSQDDKVTSYYAGPFEMKLYSVETAKYRANLETGNPKIWVSLRQDSDGAPIKIAAVTADPSEGEAYTEAGNDIVEAVPMPSMIAERMALFVAEHHVETPFYKRTLDRIDPNELGPHPRIADEY